MHTVTHQPKRPTRYLTIEAKAAHRKQIETDIQHGHDIAHKTHGFDNDHDPTKVLMHFFQETHEGLVLFVIFYTQACRWMRCVGCTLPSTSSLHHVSFKDITKQTHNLFEEADVLARAHEVKKVIVSNQGSVLDQETFPSTALIHLVAKCNTHLPNMEVLTLESRPGYVDDEELIFLSRVLEEGDQITTLEIAVGVEAFDKRIRNKIFHKNLSLSELEELAKRLTHYDFRLKCYFMFKPVVEMSDDDAVRDIQDAISYLGELRALIPGSVISMHLNPTYVAKGTPMVEAFQNGHYDPPHLINIIRAIRFGEKHGVPIYVGMNVEELAVEGGSFIRPGDGELVRLIEQFNRTQDYSLFAHLPA